MNDVERLLELDRNAPIPDVPDSAFTAAAVARRVGPRRGQEPARLDHWLLTASAAAVGVGLTGLALLMGVAPFWLMMVPLLLVPLFPILRKGAR